MDNSINPGGKGENWSMLQAIRKSKASGIVNKL
jgi:hypothetical protein